MKTRKAGRQGGRQGRVGKVKPARSERRGGRRPDASASLLPTEVFRQLGQDLYAIGEDLREPITDLARNSVEHAFELARAFTRSVGDLIEDAVVESDRFRSNLERRIRDFQRSLSPS